MAGRSAVGGLPSGSEPLSDGLAPPFRAPFFGAGEQLRHGASLLGGHRRMRPAELAQQRRAHRQVQVVSGPQQPLLLLPRAGSRSTQLRKRSSSPASLTPASSAAAASRSESTRRKPVNAASDPEGASRP